jgi:MFS family permease
LWRNRTFLSLFAAYTLSIFGGTFHTIALNIWILKTYDSATLMSAILITHLLISSCFASIAGTAADRMNRKKMMWISDLIRCVLVIGLAAAIYVHPPFWVIILLTALTALSGLFKGPAFNASLIDVVGKKNIQTATGAMSLADNIARTLGFAAGGVIVAAFGGVTAILIDAFMFLLSVILVVIVKDFPEHRAAFTAKTTFKQDFMTGFTYIWKEPFARAITILSPTLILFFTTTLMIIQVMAIKEWRASPIEFGLIEASIPLGYMAGAGLIMFLGEKLVHRGDKLHGMEHPAYSIGWFHVFFLYTACECYPSIRSYKRAARKSVRNDWCAHKCSAPCRISTRFLFYRCIWRRTGPLYLRTVAICSRDYLLGAFKRY